MGEKKGSAVLLTVIGIATLLVTLVGATYAYFTARINDGENTAATDVVITAAELGTIVFDNKDTVTLDNAYPGNGDSVDFTITAAEGATAGVEYKVWLEVSENTYITDNLQATLTGSTDKGVAPTVTLATGASLKSTGAHAKGSKVEIGSGTIMPGAVDSWNLAVNLIETHAEQNDDQSKLFSAKITVSVDSEHYTQQSVYGE